MSTGPAKSPEATSTRTATSNTVKVAVLTVGIAGMALVGWVGFWMKNGFDITDESFYLLWIQDPGNYSVAGSQFGSVYQSLYYLLGQDVISLRRVNLVITITLATVLSALTLQQAFRDRKESNTQTLSSKLIWVLSFAIASTSTSVYFLWLTTPSYNILTFQGLIVVAIGWTMATRNLNPKSLAGWILLSAGGWLVFLAKPTSALLVAFVSLVVLTASRKFALKPVLISIGAGLVLALGTALAVSGSISAFISRIADGATATDLMGGHGSDELVSTLVNKFWFGLQSPLPVLLIAIVVATATYVGIRYARIQVPLATVSVLVATSVFLILLLNPTTLTPLPVLSAAAFLGLLVGTICGSLFSLVQPNRDEGDRVGQTIQLSLESVIVAAALIFLPFCYFIGTNNVPLAAMAGASYFWVLSAAVFVALKIYNLRGIAIVSLVVVTGQCLTALALNQAFVNPYRSEATIAESNIPVSLPSSGSTVQMNRHNARYFSELKDLADNYEFKLGDSLIELTGHTPGAALAIGGKPVGSPWLLGGYTGSTDSVEFLFSKTLCNSIGTPWVITAPNSSRAIPTSTLEVLGIDFPSSYIRVGEVTANKSTGIQFLWRPTKTPNEMLKNCEQSRFPDQQRKE